MYHGVLLASGTPARSYDAYVHMFFADHYAHAWFDNWDPRWYAGFTVTSYPPGVHQSIALLSFVFGLVGAYSIVQMAAILLDVLGMYRFARIWVREEAAGYAALLYVFAPSVALAVHPYGQLPTTLSLGFMLNGLAFVRRWLDGGRRRDLLAAWVLGAATTAAHHVTTLFGVVFFVAPVVVAALTERARRRSVDEPPWVSRMRVPPLLTQAVRRVLPTALRAAVYGGGLVLLLVIVVLPYWIWSITDPIRQVPIPHSSRESFIANPVIGLIGFVIPYGLLLALIPYGLYTGLRSRAWPLTLSFALLCLLGTGGTTPLPHLILRGAYEIVTLDRFTFWAIVCLLPLAGEFVVSLRHGALAAYGHARWGLRPWGALQMALGAVYLAISILAANITQIIPFQPAPIAMQPIVSFLSKDLHWQWRYITLGFGDQAAWLSTLTDAPNLDGDYPSVRRIPEMTTTPVGKLDSAKFYGAWGLSALQQILATPEKYNLAFVFSADAFYDPLLYFDGWYRVQRLDNGVMVWARGDIPALPAVLPRREIPAWQRALWGIMPMSAITAALLVLAPRFWLPGARYALTLLDLPRMGKRAARRRPLSLPWRAWYPVDRRLYHWAYLSDARPPNLPAHRVLSGRTRLLRPPRLRPPTTRQILIALVALCALAALDVSRALSALEPRTPTAVVEAYYHDLDFRGFAQAYALLDAHGRPSLDQYEQDLSTNAGLVASYAKLNATRVHVLRAAPDQVVALSETDWLTALGPYPTVQTLTLVRRDGHWRIAFPLVSPSFPSTQFVRRGTVSWYLQHRPVSTGLKAFADVLDRPRVQILSARLVRVNGRYSVVGEVLDSDVNPASTTISAYLMDTSGQAITWDNAGPATMHEILPREVTPFRVDFTGVAAGPLASHPAIGSFTVAAKALVTQSDLYRDVGAQDVRVRTGADGRPHVTGELFNAGTVEAAIPQVLITLYDAQGRVAWVDQSLLPNAIPPQQAQPFDVPLTPGPAVATVSTQGFLYAARTRRAPGPGDAWRDRIPLPRGLGYASLRISVNYFVRGES